MYNKQSIEKPLEHKFVKWCKEHGIADRQFKGPSSMFKGIPDRILLVPNGGGTWYIEFKGGTYYQLTAMQKEWQTMIEESTPPNAQYYFEINTYEELDDLFNKINCFLKN